MMGLRGGAPATSSSRPTRIWRPFRTRPGRGFSSGCGGGHRPGLLGGGEAAGHADLRREIARHLAAWRGIDCQAGPAQSSPPVRANRWTSSPMASSQPEPGSPWKSRATRWRRRVLIRAGHHAIARRGRRERPRRVRRWGNSGNPRLRRSSSPPRGIIPWGRRSRLPAVSTCLPGHATPIRPGSSSRTTTTASIAITASRCPPSRRDSIPRAPVIYLGSFSKVLRLHFCGWASWWCVHHSRDGFLDALAGTGPRAALTAQPVLARFMASGDFARHIRRMRRLYARRQAVLVRAAAERHLWG